MEWFLNNIGTIIVLIILCAVVFFIIRGMIKNRKAGKSSCGCGCSSCASSSICHSSKKKA